MTKVAGLQLSLSDIARLADVQRPVVSMWRRRPVAGRSFPNAVARVSGEERFDASEVADYLAATSRGNNPDAGEDLVAHAKLAQLTDLDDVVVVDGLTALLCLGTMTDEPLGSLSTTGLRDLARAVDPDDTYLLREIVASDRELARLGRSRRWPGERLVLTPRRVRATADASERQPPTRAMPPRPWRRQPRLSSPGRRSPSRPTPVPRLHVSSTSPTAVLTSSSQQARRMPPSWLPASRHLSLDSPVARLARRRLRVHDIHRMSVVSDDAGDFALLGDSGDVAVHVLQVPPAGEPGLSDLEVLDFLGNLVVQLSDDARVVVIGPASALTDRAATAEIDLARDAVIRGDRLRAAIRLPLGLLPRSPRRALALWVLGPAHEAVSVRDRWTVVADVSDRSLDEIGHRRHRDRRRGSDDS